MSAWNAMTPEGKDTILQVVRNEAEQFFALVDGRMRHRDPHHLRTERR